MSHPQNKKGQPWIIEVLLFLAVVLATQLIEGILIGTAAFLWGLFGGSLEGGVLPEPLLLVNLFATLPATVAVLVFCRYGQGRHPADLGLGCKRAVTEYLIGVPVGIGLFAAAFGICLAAGALETSPAPEFSGTVGRWLLFLAGYLLQGMSEEVLCRGYFMGSLLRRYRPWVAIVTNPAAFSLLHLANRSVSVLALVNIFLFGVLMSLYVLQRGNLWGACAIHSLWNFVQGNVFGIRVSGNGMGPSLLRTLPLDGATLWNGGGFGLEGGFAVTLTLSAALALLLLPNLLKKKRNCT